VTRPAGGAGTIWFLEWPRQPLLQGSASTPGLAAKHWAWLGSEYHARKHETTGRIPRDHLLADAHEIRAVSRDKQLDEIFLHRTTRKVRKDGTVRWRGGYLEVRAELSGASVELRFDPEDERALPRVFVGGTFFCDTVPLDRLANMHRRRRRIAGDPSKEGKQRAFQPLARASGGQQAGTARVTRGSRRPPGPRSDASRSRR
jgi:hypothetical protein